MRREQRHALYELEKGWDTAMKRDETKTYQMYLGWRITLTSKQLGIHVRAQHLTEPDKHICIDKLFPFTPVALRAIKERIEEAEKVTLCHLRL